jgi:hypothetical protein
MRERQYWSDRPFAGLAQGVALAEGVGQVEQALALGRLALLGEDGRGPRAAKAAISNAATVSAKHGDSIPGRAPDVTTTRPSREHVTILWLVRPCDRHGSARPSLYCKEVDHD